MNLVFHISEDGSEIWGGLPAYLAAELENIQSRSLDIIGLPRDFLLLWKKEGKQ